MSDLAEYKDVSDKNTSLIILKEEIANKYLDKDKFEELKTSVQL